MTGDGLPPDDLRPEDLSALDRDLERLLRDSVESVAPREGAFELITKRARRRKTGKAVLSAAAAVAVVAGAAPAVIAVRHNSSDQSIRIADTSGPQPQVTGTTVPAPAVPTPVQGLVGFFPRSVSFVSQTDGFLWGTVQGTHAGAIAPHGVVAVTHDGGKSWVADGGPPVSATSETQIRFASSAVGFVFGGAKPYLTVDGGAHWEPYSVPGHLSDLEAMRQKIWALVRPSAHSNHVELYAAIVADPTLSRVSGVPALTALRGGRDGATGAASIALSDSSVDVLFGSNGFYTSPNGNTFRRQRDPCPTTLGQVPVTPMSTVIAAGSNKSLVAACGYGASGGVQTKLVYESQDAGRTWGQALKPPVGGYLETITAGTDTIIIGNSRGGAVLTRDNGQSWQAAPAGQTDLSFVGFIDYTHVVAVADRADEAEGAFATSTDSGHHWSVVTFPCDRSCPS